MVITKQGKKKRKRKKEEEEKEEEEIYNLIYYQYRLVDAQISTIL